MTAVHGRLAQHDKGISTPVTHRRLPKGCGRAVQGTECDRDEGLLAGGEGVLRTRLVFIEERLRPHRRKSYVLQGQIASPN